VKFTFGSWRNHVARGLLIVGAVVVSRVIVPELPRKNLLKLDLGAAGQAVGRIELEWTRDGEDSPRGGASLRFKEKAPKLVVFPLDLTTGDYSFQVVLHRNSDPSAGQSATTFRRHLRLGGGETTVSLYRHP
jgi:hypothetical protein